jgi:adenosylcobinamide kinase/adenosylcobinamide-phosphate guanylyltransferase
MARKLVFITGGARSGKSSFALKEASSVPGRKVFIATAEAIDSEMKERIERHRRDRGPGWETCEEPLHLSRAIEEMSERYDVLVLDCLTIWLSNVILAGSDAEREIEELVCTIERFAGNSPAMLFIVSNEVGMGIVPDNEIARKFRDFAGRLNQKVAEVSAEVYWTVAGLPVKIKGEGER